MITTENEQPRGADLAWVTRRKEWINTKKFSEFSKDFEYWKSIEEGKSEIKEHQEKVEFIKKSFSKENLEKMPEQEFRECWKRLYASQIINIAGRNLFFQNNIINANGGFENVRTKVIELLYGEDPIYERYEKGINEIKQFGDATVSEILNNVYPDECCIWNDKVKKAFPILGIKKLVPKKFLEGKSIRKADDYEKCNQLLSLIKNELSQYEIKDFFELDHFFWYVSTRQFWRIQPGSEAGKWWPTQRDNELIAVSWDIAEDLSKVDKISDIVKKYHPLKNSQITHQLEKFVKEIQIGDIVIANNGQSEIFAIGKITGQYNYRSDLKQHPHCREVHWFDVTRRTIPKQDWGIQTIKKINRDIFTRIESSTTTPLEEIIFDPLSEKYAKILEEKKQIVLYGPPGTGKTYFARKLASSFYKNDYLDTQDANDVFDILQKSGFVDIVQFHPSYSYEDFVEGIRPITNENTSQLDYKIQDGIFKKFCLAADSVNEDYDHYYALISNFQKISKPITAENLSLPRSHGGGMNELSKSEFKKILKHVESNEDSITEIFENIDNFSSFFRLNTKETSNYGDIDGARYHFSESAHSYKKFLDSIQAGNVVIAYHDRERGGFFGIAVIYQNNFVKNPKFILIIDEINRGNLSKIFGELIFGLEYRDTGIRTQYSEFQGESSLLKIPKNLLMIGTMNTADRSISLFDTALRRRFAFIELLPDYDLLVKHFGIADEFNYSELYKKLHSEGGTDPKILSILALYRINREIIKDIQLGREKQVGHSYIIRLADDITQFYNIWRYEIIPLIEEFYYSESEKIETILGNNIFDKNEGIKDFTDEELIDCLNNLAKLGND